MRRVRYREVSAGLIGLVALLALPWLMPNAYYADLLNQAAIFVIAVVGLNYILGWAGQVSLAQAGLYAIGAYTSGLVAVRLGVPFWGGFLAAMVCTAAFGLVLGVPSLRLRGHYLAVATVGFGEIARLVLNNWNELTFGAEGVRGIPRPAIGDFVVADDRVYYYLILAVLVIGLVVAWRVQRSSFGRVLNAIRQNEATSSVVGINTSRYKIMAFVFSAVYAGAAGSLDAHRIAYISPDTYSFDLTIRLVAMLFLGGIGTLTGSTVGAVLLTFLPAWLHVLRDYWQTIYGLGLVVLVIFLPYGIVGVYQRHVHSRAARLLARWLPQVRAGLGPGSGARSGS